MGARTGIEWTDCTWSPIRARVKTGAAVIAKRKGYVSLVDVAKKMAGRVGPHCEVVSQGCFRCYSEANNARCLPANGTGLPFDRRARDLVEIFVDEKLITLPVHWKKPRRIFVENQSDLFGEFVPNTAILRIFFAMEEARKHTYQVLTKRTLRATEILRSIGRSFRDQLLPWPLAHVWLGFSAENQETFDERWAHMKELAEAGWLVWCSYEPALGPLDMRQALRSGLRWVVLGGESGRNARPCWLEWIDAVIQQCRQAAVPCFVKQVGSRPLWPIKATDVRIPGHPDHYRPILRDAKGGDPSEWPDQIQVRQLPGDMLRVHRDLRAASRRFEMMIHGGCAPGRRQ